MSARRAALHAAYWTGLLLTAAVASLAGVLATAVVSLIGLACAPTLNTRKDGAQ